MAALIASKVPPDSPDMSSIPELSDAAYFNEVLRLPIEKSESHVEDELIAKAHELGLSPVLLSRDKRYTSSAESASTALTYHGRTFSTASKGSASTDLTVHSFTLGPDASDSVSADHSDEKRQSKTVSFSQYDKYLAAVDKNLDQPKFRKASAATADPSSKSLFSVSTKRSLASVKSNIKNKMRWRRKSIQPFVPTLYVRT
jgi:hypothetical protein